MLFEKAGVWLALAAVQATAAVYKRQSELPSISLPVHDVAYLAENNTFLENVAMRPNGDLLVTQLEAEPKLYLLKDAASPGASLTLLHRFPNATGLIGITSLGHDTYVLTSQRFQSFLNPFPNTTAMWEVKFVDPFSDDFTVRKIVDLPEVGMLNGLATVPRLPARSCDKAATWILAADCLNGQIVRLETTTGAHETVLDIPQLHASPDGAFPVGVNGLKIHGGYLYWTNTEKVTFFRIRIDEDGYPLEDAQAETIITIPSLHALDDFIFDPEGNIWGVGSTENQVFVIHRDRSTPDGYGSLQFVAGALDSLAIPGPTSCIFGKGDDSKTLYILTSGGIVMPINGTLTQPAKVAAVDTSSFYHR